MKIGQEQEAVISNVWDSSASQRGLEKAADKVVSAIDKNTGKVTADIQKSTDKIVSGIQKSTDAIEKMKARFVGNADWEISRGGDPVNDATLMRPNDTFDIFDGMRICNSFQDVYANLGG